MKKRHSAAGFTLLELLVVIVIIGIVGTLGVTSFLSSQRQSRDGRRMADLKQIQNALENYYIEESAYPAGNCQTSLGTYLPQGFPNEPVTNEDYEANACEADNYCFCVQLENSTTRGNSDNNSCGFSDDGGPFFCVKNIQ